MPTCPNKNTPNWKALKQLVPEIANHVWNKLNGAVDINGYPENNRELFDKLLVDNNNDWNKSYINFLSPSTQSRDIDYQFKSINIITSNINKIENWSKQIKNIDQLFDKIQKDLGIPKEQINLLKESEGNNINEKLLDFISKYSYSIQVNTVLDQEQVPTKEPTQYYSRLTVPGGANYTENEISTPLITPSIKGHAQFSTDNGIGWFRSDEQVVVGTYKETSEFDLVKFEKEQYNKYIKGGLSEQVAAARASMDANFENDRIIKEGEPTKTRRILEIQSDLFQKGRGIEDLVSKNDIDAYFALANKTGLEPYSKELDELYGNKSHNQFLQLLNKGDNWVTFFIKSIIQDSAKKGYEKVLFPKGETAAKVEGHQTIVDELQSIEMQINELSSKDSIDAYNHKRIKELEQKKSELKSQGIEKLKPIEAFYEIKVQNIIKKLDPNIKIITDEYSNQWLEYIITEKDLNNIEFQKSDKTSYIFNKKLNDDIKQILQKLYPEVKLDYTTNLEGIRGQYQAGKVLINSLLQNTDTLPHEYAHHYIKMFRNTSIIKQGIELFGSEEKLVQVIGEQSIRSLKWYQQFYDWIKSLFNSKQSLLNELTNNFLERNDLLNKSIISNEIMYQLINKKDIFNIPSGLSNLPLSEDVLTDDLSQLDAISEIKAKAIRALETKLELEVRRKNLTEDDIISRKDFIEKLSKLEAEQSLVLFTKQAAKNTASIVDEYNTKLKESNNEEDVFTPQMLYRWRDYLSAYDTIEDFQTYLIQNNQLVNNPELDNILTTTIKNKNAIQKLYETKGLDMIAKYLAPHYNALYKQFEILTDRQYDSLSEAIKSKITKEEYVEQQTALHNQDLKQKTIIALKTELLKASKDISVIGRWVENVQDSSDPVIAAAAEALGIATMKSQSLTVEAKEEIVDSLRELEKFQGSSTNKKAFYDFILEKDYKGNYTGNIIDRFGSEFWTQYENQREYAKTLESKVRKAYVKSWLGLNTVFDKISFGKDKWALINRLKEEGKISDQEYTELEWNDVSYTPLSAHQMQEENMLNIEAADAISDWVFSNVWNYRQPTSKWVTTNKGWRELETILKDSNDPRTKYYNTIKKYEAEANKFLPANLRLRSNRLPGVIKSNEERIQDKEPIKVIAKEAVKKQFNILADDTTRGNAALQDEQGNERNFIPAYYTSKLDIKDQSFDLSTIYLKYYQMAADYGMKSNILPQMEMARFFINNRSIAKTDSQGNPIYKTYRTIEKKIAEKVTKSKGNNQLADQFNDWFEMIMYGKKEIAEGDFNFFGLKIDKAKALNFMNKFTALNVLALNFRSGVSNIVLGEALQTGEAFASQYMTTKSYTKANKFFWEHIMGTIEDIGARKPNGLVNRLYEQFQIAPEPVDTNLKDNSRAKALTKTSSLYFIMHSGDFYMQSRLFLGMLANKEAKDNEGNVIGSMLDMYTVKDGKLILDSKVDLGKSKWAEEDQRSFSLRTKGIMSGIHGEYSEIGRSAMQKYALGRMGIMFRKFIVPGLKRRYKKVTYVQRINDYSEGYYRTTTRFFGNVFKEMKTMQLSALGQEWNSLSKMEKSNIIRTMADVVFLIAAIVLAGIFLGGEDDDDDDKGWWADFMAYQMLRFKTELLFFTPKIDEAMTLLRSPMATMSTFENVTKLSNQIFSPTEEYERGPWKEHLKLEKIFWDFIPVARAFNQTRDIKTQINFLR